METARFVLTPFYECVDSIIPLTQLRMTNSVPDVKPGRFIGNQMIEFSLQWDHSFLLSESKKHKSNKFDIRAIIRFCNVEDISKIDDQYTLKDCFPLHLKLNLNNTSVTLPQFLPNDRSGKDGRRFPRPVDLSEGLLDNPLIINKFLLQWVQDDCKKETYYFAVYLVRRRTCEELTYILLKKQLSPIKNTLNFIQEQSNHPNNFQDDDLMLVETTIKSSLICPVSRVRMSTPVRGQHCSHIQCFDCITYLIMNFNKPTWQCPVCDKKTFFCYLEVDSLILGILNDPRSASVSSVVFNKIGQWKPDKTIPLIAGTDDEPFYDITGYTNDVETSNNTYSMMTENSNVDNYLTQILHSTSRASLMNRFRQPNSIFSQFPLSQFPVPNRATALNSIITEPLPRPPFHSVTQQSSHSVLTPMGPFQDNIRHISAVTSSMNINPNAAVATGNGGHHNAHTRMKMGTKLPEPLTVHMTINTRNHHHSRSKPVVKSISVDNTSPQIKITNVTSIAKNHKDTSQVIVISDDESDDIPAQSDKESVIKMLHRAHKRPTTVSSVPSTVDSVKSQKLSDNLRGHASMRMYAASAPSVLDSPRSECSCTSNTMCVPHRELLLRNRVGFELPPVNERPVPNPMKNRDIVDLTQVRGVPCDDGQKQHIRYTHRAPDPPPGAIKLNPTAQIPPLIDSNRSAVKEFIKNLQIATPTDNILNSGVKHMIDPATPFTIQHRPPPPIDPMCSLPREYLQQQWMNMMMSSAQSPFSPPQSMFFHQSPQFNTNGNSSLPPNNVNPFINQPNAFFNC